MGAPFLSIDAGLNLIWAVLSLGVLVCWDAEWKPESRRALVALVCVLVLLFPAISLADDVAELSLLYDTAGSSFSGNSGKEIKQIAAPDLQLLAAAQAALGRLYEAFGEAPSSPTATHSTYFLLASSTGIHSPPQL